MDDHNHEDMGEKAHDMMEEGKEKLEHAGEKIKEGWEKTKDKVTGEDDNDDVADDDMAEEPEVGAV